jgi:2-polyprenyl-3-methyl-5-hydroxy-6-metoxy-1,4-benzoquinol methylase
MYSVDACMVCGEVQRTIVSEYNRLIFIESMRQSDLARFDYALCHGCGLVYATRRPDRAEYQTLYDNFNEFLVRRANRESLNVPELTPEKAAEIDQQFIPWWELQSARRKGRIVKMLRHELNNARAYLPYITPHVSLEGAKILHVRAKGSTLADIMKRTLGAAQVDLITLFPAHTYLAQKNDGIRAQSCLDYENFQIPYDEKYDLIIENHIFIHMLDPNQTFDTFRSHLEPGGAIFLHKEIDDDDLFAKGKNLFAELRPFHYQQFDKATLERLVRRYGFEPVSLSNKEDEDTELVGIIRLQREPTACPRIAPEALQARLEMYARWRDESILSLPKEHCHALFGAELDQVWKRVRARGNLHSVMGTPTGLRRFREVEGDDELLEISSIGDWRRRLSRGLADALHRTRLAGPLARILRGTRAAAWIAHRATGNRVSKRAERAARLKMERRALKQAERMAEKTERRALKEAKRTGKSERAERTPGLKRSANS